MLDITCEFFSSYDEERMVEDWISICGFLEDVESKKGKVLKLFQDGTGIQEMSGQKGLIFFEELGLEIQDKNSPKRTYLVNIRMGYVPCRGREVSNIKPPRIMLLNKVELVQLGLRDSVGHDDDAYSLLINPTLLMRTLQFENDVVLVVQL